MQHSRAAPADCERAGRSGSGLPSALSLDSELCSSCRTDPERAAYLPVSQKAQTLQSVRAAQAEQQASAVGDLREARLSSASRYVLVAVENPVQAAYRPGMMCKCLGA